jgi:hypothetical protein
LDSRDVYSHGEVTVYTMLAGVPQEKGHKHGYDDNTKVS